MREIKFRAWDEKEKCWVSGFAIHQSGMFSDWAGCKKINGQCVADADWKYRHEIPHIKIVQYTGLRDKNGKEIYKGDIVKYALYEGGNEMIGVVGLGVYEQDGSGGEYGPTKCFGFYIERIKTIPNDWEIKYGWEPNEPEYEKTVSLLQPIWIEVIGNGFENPELLKGDGNDVR